MITGHSLGASISDLFAIEIQKNIRKVDILYTFENPRTGNRQFADYHDKLLPDAFRTSHFDDIIVHGPPLMFGFKHHSTEVYFNKDCSTFKVCDGSGEDPECSNQWDVFMSGVWSHLCLYEDYTGCTSDHEGCFYFEEIEEMMKTPEPTVEQLLMERV